MNYMLIESHDLVELFNTDLSSDPVGPWLDSGAVQNCEVLLASGTGTSGQDPVITFQQATDNAGSGAKPLLFKELFERNKGNVNPYDPGDWVHVQLTTPVDNYTNADAAENFFDFNFPVHLMDFDAENGFSFFQLTVSGVTAAQSGTCWLLGESRYQSLMANQMLRG